MKYKIGDTVKIRSDLANFSEFDNCFITLEMKKMANETFKIRAFHSSGTRCLLEKDDDNWSWTSEMFESVDAKISFNYLIL